MISVHDDTYIQEKGKAVIYLAGGPFWALEKYMQAIPGVIKVTSGYVNGLRNIKPSYKRVSKGTSGYQIAVRVEYSQAKISLEAILFAYFRVIDPTVENGQGKYKGSQYQTGIYFSDQTSGRKVLLVSNVERLRHTEFKVETVPLVSFYEAEEDCQNYLEKHPDAESQISQNMIGMVSRMIVNPANYPHPGRVILKKRLTEEQYRVTQMSETETPFKNQYWDKFEKGIYADIVTGEPLFTSTDKYKCSSGWPTFSRVIDENSLVYSAFTYQGKAWVGLSSRTGNTHLGRFFYDDPESPTGYRYSINSASLHFIPYEKMEKKGYSFLKVLVK
jgi:peptide methionine sulfoxide reductase msrA/msrB